MIYFFIFTLILVILRLLIVYKNKNINKLIKDVNELNIKLKEKDKIIESKIDVIEKYETFSEERQRVQQNIANITSYNNHLTNVIRGISHEVSPWLGSLANIAEMAKEEINEKGDNSNFHLSLINYFNDIKKAAHQASDVLVLTSKSVKKLRNWSTSKSNILDTIHSWGHIALMEHDIKGKLSINNLIIDDKSLNFEVLHSPMLTSQIVLNLVKNSIDHNKENLENLVIKIYGNKENTIFIEDNGVGISPEIIKNIFHSGISTKIESNVATGLGLSNSVDYCILMNAKIKVESKVEKYTKFHIEFKKSEDSDCLLRGINSRQRSDFYEIIEINNLSTNKKLETGPLINTNMHKRLEEIDKLIKHLK